MRSDPAVGVEATLAKPGAQPSWRVDLAWVAFGLALLLGWDALGLDLPLVRLFASADGFPLRDHWLTSGVAHQGGRLLSIALFVLTCAACLRPFGPWRRLGRSERVWWLGITIACLVLIPQIKRHSGTSCPWDVQEFGGTAQHLSHWLGLWPLKLADGGPGRCFPSGHASGAFSFVAIGLVLRRSAPFVARRWLIGLTLLGLMFGLAQMARGAHYASHTLYTAWICASSTALSWQALQSWRSRSVRDEPVLTLGALRR
jgi:membrane-associated PAP2 superfamily phosphatase